MIDRIAIITLGLAVVAGSALAEDGAKLFAAKCVSCHTATGAGKAAMKGTNLLTEAAKKKTDAELADAISTGGAAKKATHAFGKKGVSAADVDALVKHVRVLQK